MSKSCEACDWCGQYLGTIGFECRSPQVPDNYVKRCSFAIRNDVDLCGPEAKWFKIIPILRLRGEEDWMIRFDGGERNFNIGEYTCMSVDGPRGSVEFSLIQAKAIYETLRDFFAWADKRDAA